ncbi:MAG: MFS transporter [Deltaproteobacteria bacterium]|jgi:sugar phosphate permease|nr:MFS transporter [Deltaproteobacteria bacterium]
MPSANPAVAPNGDSYRWIILALAVSAFTMAFISRFAWPPLVPVVRPIMGINSTEAMAYMFAFYVGYVITQIPGGMLADRFGPRLVLGAALFLQAVGTFAMGSVENYQVGFAFRILCGLGAGCVYSSAFKALVSWFSPTQRGLAIGVMMTSPTLGVTIPNFLMPKLEALFGWQGAFKAIGVAIFAVMASLLILMRDAKAPPAAADRPSFAAGLKYVFRNRNILLISLAGFSNLWCQLGFGSVGNDYLVETFNVTSKEAGNVMALYGLVGLLMPAFAGYLCGAFPLRKRLCVIVAHILLAGVLIVYGGATTLRAAIVLAACVGLLIAFSNPLYTIITADNADPRWAGVAGGVGNCIYQFGSLLSPIVLGRVHDWRGDYGLTFYILAAGALIGIFVTLFTTNAPGLAPARAERAASKDG